MTLPFLTFGCLMPMGWILMEELHQHQTNLPVLILTAHGCIPNAVQAMKKGAYGYLTKPFR